MNPTLLALSWEAWATLAVLTLCIGLLASNKYSPDIILSAGLTMLLLMGILSPGEALSGMANEGMVTVGVLFVVVSGLTETGAVAWLANRLFGKVRSIDHARFKLMLPVAALSAFLNNTPVVAIFIPAVRDWAKRHRLSLSALMMPLSFASIVGGTCTLLGTSTNLVVNGLLMKETDHPGLGLFDIAWAGLPLVGVVLIFLLIAGRWLIPERLPVISHRQDTRQYTVEMVVEPDSPLIGQTIEEAGLRHLPELYLMEIERCGQLLPAVSPRERLQQDDRLIFVGVVDSVVDLRRFRGLRPATNQIFKLGGERQDRCLVEAVVSNSCPLIGKTVREGHFRTRYNAVIIAIARNGERINRKIGDIVLRPGDTLLLETNTWFAEQQHNSRDFFLVSTIRDSQPPRHDHALLAAFIAAGMVGSVLFGLFSMLEAAMLAAGLMIVSRCTTGGIARRAVDWQILIVIAASFGIGIALHKSGAASAVAQSLITLSGETPIWTLALVFLTTALFTALATNNAAAVIMFPIALDTAQRIGADFMPFVITLMIAASASFATPIGYQTNLMVFSVGGYRFSDYLRVGLPLTFLVGITTLLIVPRVWPF